MADTTNIDSQYDAKELAAWLDTCFPAQNNWTPSKKKNTGEIAPGYFSTSHKDVAKLQRLFIDIHNAGILKEQTKRNHKYKTYSEGTNEYHKLIIWIVPDKLATHHALVTSAAYQEDSEVTPDYALQSTLGSPSVETIQTATTVTKANSRKRKRSTSPVQETAIPGYDTGSHSDEEQPAKRKPPSFRRAGTPIYEDTVHSPPPNDFKRSASASASPPPELYLQRHPRTNTPPAPSQLPLSRDPSPPQSPASGRG